MSLLLFVVLALLLVVLSEAFRATTASTKAGLLGRNGAVHRFGSTGRSLVMSLKEGDIVPSVTFKARVRDDTLPQPNPFKWKDVGTDELFRGKRCVLLALPGGESLRPTVGILWLWFLVVVYEAILLS
jgi:hypothetical protein